MHSGTSIAQLNLLIHTYLKAQAEWSTLNHAYVRARAAQLSAKMDKKYMRPDLMDELLCAGVMDRADTCVVELKKTADDLRWKVRAFSIKLASWGFYTSALVGVKMMMEGKLVSTCHFDMELAHALIEKLVLIKDRLVEAVADPDHIRSLEDWMMEDHETIVDLGNIFRPYLNKLEATFDSTR